MKQQTAVEWLDEQLQDTMFIEYGYSNSVRKIVIPIDAYMELKQQAKQMEKEQMKKTWQDGFSFQSPYKNFQQYYNETYNK